MLDDGEADDKIIAVLDGVLQWGDALELSELPSVLVERLHHYFMTYKLAPGTESVVTIGEAYGRERAEEVVRAAAADYDERFGNSGVGTP